MSTWRNRIVADGDADPASITDNPLNWRVHPKIQRATVEDSLDKIGWFQKPVINRTTGHLIDGHLRVASAVSRGETSIPVCYVELTPDEERAALASLDPIWGWIRRCVQQRRLSFGSPNRRACWAHRARSGHRRLRGRPGPSADGGVVHANADYVLSPAHAQHPRC